MLMRDTNFFQEVDGKSRILGGVKPVRTRGRKARREEGEIKITPETKSLFGACLSTTKPPSEVGGFDKAGRQMTPEGPDGDISMKCKESACGMDRSVLMRT